MHVDADDVRCDAIKGLERWSSFSPCGTSYRLDHDIQELRTDREPGLSEPDGSRDARRGALGARHVFFSCGLGLSFAGFVPCFRFGSVFSVRFSISRCSYCFLSMLLRRLLIPFHIVQSDFFRPFHPLLPLVSFPCPMLFSPPCPLADHTTLLAPPNRNSDWKLGSFWTEAYVWHAWKGEDTMGESMFSCVIHPFCRLRQHQRIFHRQRLATHLRRCRRPRGHLLQETQGLRRLASFLD